MVVVVIEFEAITKQMEKYLSTKRLSTIIGLSPRTIRKWITNPVNPLRCYRVGDKLLFEESEVVQWLEQFRVSTVDVEEIADEIISNLGKDTNNEPR